MRTLSLAVVALWIGGIVPQAMPAYSQPSPAPRCFGQPATIVGTEEDDTLEGTSANDVIVGLRGDDKIRGHGGNDLICSGRGDDELFGQHGFDQIKGSPNFNNFVTILGGPGNDQLFSSSSQGTLRGGPDNDYISSRGPHGCTANGTYGGKGEDVIQGDACWDEAHGGKGNDKLYGAGSSPRQARNVLDDELYGGPGNDKLYGENGNDHLFGGSGFDILRGARGIDYCSSGEREFGCKAAE